MEVTSPGTATCNSSDGSCAVRTGRRIDPHPERAGRCRFDLAGWSGACNGTQNPCAFVISANAAVTASFQTTAPPVPNPSPPAPGPSPVPDPPAPGPAPVPTPPPAPAPGPTPGETPEEPSGTAPDGCTITGTPGPDVLVGTAGRDVICGLGGNDSLLGKGGNDVLIGGAGKDTVIGGLGRDRLTGGAGYDRMSGGKGIDVLYARDGLADRLDGGAGRDRARVDRKRRPQETGRDPLLSARARGANREAGHLCTAVPRPGSFG